MKVQSSKAKWLVPVDNCMVASLRTVGLHILNSPNRTFARLPVNEVSYAFGSSSLSMQDLTFSCPEACRLPVITLSASRLADQLIDIMASHQSAGSSYMQRALVSLFGQGTLLGVGESELLQKLTRVRAARLLCVLPHFTTLMAELLVLLVMVVPLFLFLSSSLYISRYLTTIELSIAYLEHLKIHVCTSRRLDVYWPARCYRTLDDFSC